MSLTHFISQRFKGSSPHTIFIYLFSTRQIILVYHKLTQVHSLNICSTATHFLPQDRYEQFMFATRIWRHLKLAKRGGRGHDPTGVDRTEPGQCAVECPACPHPGRNLPPDWDKIPEPKK